MRNNLESRLKGDVLDSRFLFVALEADWTQNLAFSLIFIHCSGAFMTNAHWVDVKIHFRGYILVPSDHRLSKMLLTVSQCISISPTSVNISPEKMLNAYVLKWTLCCHHNLHSQGHINDIMNMHTHWGNLLSNKHSLMLLHNWKDSPTPHKQARTLMNNKLKGMWGHSVELISTWNLPLLPLSICALWIIWKNACVSVCMCVPVLNPPYTLQISGWTFLLAELN